MDTNKQLQKRPWIIAGLLVLALLSTAMTGCQNHATSSSANNTFVDVNGLRTAPTKAAASYPTENLNLGNDSCAGIPQFLDGTLYTFSYRNDGNQWTTAWNQTTGKKLWLWPTNADASLSPTTTFVTDGKYLFFIKQQIYKSEGTPDDREPCFIYLNEATGVDLQGDILLEPVGTLYTHVLSNIALHVNEQSHTPDKIYLLCDEGERNPSAPSNPMIDRATGRGVEIRVRDIATAAMLDSLDMTGIPVYRDTPGRLLCDGDILYACVPSSATASTLVAFDLRTNERLWTQVIGGTIAKDMVKQGDALVIPYTVSPSTAVSTQRWIDVWKASAQGSQRLWTRQVFGNSGEMNIASVYFAVDSTHVYLEDINGILLALDLKNGNEVWRQHFSPYKRFMAINHGSESDWYPDMTLTTVRNLLYVQDGGGLVASVDPTTGKKLWEKRISEILWDQQQIDNAFVFHPVDKGFLVIASNGKVDLWN